MMNPFSSRCCQHNHSMGWPYFDKHLWLATPDNGLCAAVYSASEVTAQVGDGTHGSHRRKKHIIRSRKKSISRCTRTSR